MKHLLLEDIYVVNKPQPIEQADLAQLARVMGNNLPKGYEDFLGNLGVGYVNNWLRIYHPSEIMDNYVDFQQRLEEFYLWEEEPIPKERAIASIFLADTMNGDELYFYPLDQDFHILPRNLDVGIKMLGDFLEVIRWICLSGELIEATDKLYFESHNDTSEQAYIDFDETKAIIDINQLEKELLALGNYDNYLSELSEDEHFVKFFYESFGGSVAIGVEFLPETNLEVVQEGAAIAASVLQPPMVRISYDNEAEGVEQLDTLVTYFESRGYMRT